jgi:hypothetical protein
MTKARELADVIGTQSTTENVLQGRRNLIINGAMQVAQRGTSSTNSGYGSVDRFSCALLGGTTTHSQESLTSGDPFDLGFRNFVRLTNTNVITDAATDYRAISQTIEAQNLACSGWDYTSSSSSITLSFWVRSSVAQTYYGYFRILDAAYLQSFSFALAANTWTKVTKTITGASGLQIDNNNDFGMQVLFAPYWGTNFTSSGVTLDQWAAFNGGARVPDMDSTWADTDEATFEITGVQLEVGSVATPFEHRSYGEELALCQRYYQRYNNGRIAHGGWNAGNQGDVGFILSTEMRAVPSITAINLGNLLDYGVAWYAVASVNGYAESNTKYVNINVSTSAGGAAQGDAAILGNGADYSFDAEL